MRRRANYLLSVGQSSLSCLNRSGTFLSVSLSTLAMADYVEGLQHRLGAQERVEGNAQNRR
jgi:hypothetical protein